MATLTNTKIKDTYDGLLKTTDNEALDVSGVTLIEDGLGNASALSVGRSGNGVTITGSLNATLATAAQPNITSVGTLTGLSLSGDVTSTGRATFSDIVKSQNSGGTVFSYLDENGVYASNTDLYLFAPSGKFTSIYSGGSESMRIDSSGNVDIGSATSNSDKLLQVYSPTTGYNAELWLGRNSSRKCKIVAEQISANSDHNLVFYTNEPSSDATERMRITSGGYLKASNSGTYNDAAGSYHEMRSNAANTLVISSTYNTSGEALIISKMGANGDNTSSYLLIGETGGVNKIFIYGNGNVVNSNNSYGAISDAKLKENVVDASPKLDDLLQVKVRNFNYIGDDKKQLGVVAQELEEVFPSMIDESPDFEEQEVIDEEGNVTKERVDLGTTTKSVKYSVFVPMLIKAMQEQQEIINDLKARIETLEAK